MAAAAFAAELGLATLVIDEQAEPGGQIFRGIERATPADAAPLGRDYLAGRPLAAALRDSGVEYRPATTVWHIDPEAPNALLIKLLGKVGLDGAMHSGSVGQYVNKAAPGLSPSTFVSVKVEFLGNLFQIPLH